MNGIKVKNARGSFSKTERWKVSERNSGTEINDSLRKVR